MGDNDPGDRDFDAVFDHLLRLAFGVSYRVLGSVADAEDAAAEALARALVRWRRVGTLPYRDAWVMRVATNVAIDAARKRRTVPEVDDVVAGIEAGVVERADLVRALAALPRRQREVIAMRHLADLPEAEVARCLGISLNSVKKHAMRAREALRARLGDEVEEVGASAG